MIRMRVTDEEHFDVCEFEPKLFDAGLDQRNGFFEAAIDQDVPIWCRDQIGCQILRADVIQVPSDLVRWKRIGPVLLTVGKSGPEQATDHDEQRRVHEVSGGD